MSNNAKVVVKMRKLLREQQEALFQERGLATFYGQPCPKAIVAREATLEELSKKLDLLEEQIEEAKEATFAS
jgi:hypothetical protein